MRANKKTSIVTLGLALLLGCGRREEPPASPPAVGLHEAVVQGDLAVVRQHITAGSDLDQKEPLGGASPLITAAAFGRTEEVRALVEAGADVNERNNEGSTALHTASFLCRTEIVDLLLASGADKSLRNKAGATALDSVSGPFEELRGVYDLVAAALGPLGLELDYEGIRATRPKIAERLR